MGALAKRHRINQHTVAKWKERKSVQDLRTMPKDLHSMVLPIEEGVIVAIRRHTLPLDDCLYAYTPRSST